jgi:LacI family transcriptional regulator
MVTIYDIAKEANVSPATVSRVLNRQGNVRDETAQKVLRVAKKRKYSPNAMARSLRTKKTNLIGLIIPDIENPIYPAPVRGIQDLANLKDYSVIIHSTDGDERKEIDTIRRLTAAGVDGLIINISESCALLIEEIRRLRRAALPVVALGPWHSELEIDCVSVDNQKGAYMATEHLLKLGHRKIAIILGLKENLSSRERFMGYKKAMDDYCAQISEEMIVEGNFKLGSGYKAAKKLIKGSQKPNAIFCVNDVMALGALAAIQEEGLRVPEDIALIGFDDIELANLSRPSLSTVAQPKYETGKIAAELLFKQIEDQLSPGKYYSIEPNLVIRETTLKVKEMTTV